MKPNLIQKHLFTLIHLEALIVSTWIMFFDGLSSIIPIRSTSKISYILPFLIQIIYFGRYVYANYILRKNTTMLNAMRNNPWAEPIFAVVMFNIIHIGGALATVKFNQSFQLGTFFGFLINLCGTFIVLKSEIQRFRWKQNPEHQGLLFTEGLFQYSMHINYFGEWLVICSYAFVIFSGTWWFMLVVIIDFLDLYFENIPNLDAYLAQKYGEAFQEYKKSTKKFIPFIL
jgi:steroid 5-alpha reductase family enzyme